VTARTRAPDPTVIAWMLLGLALAVVVGYLLNRPSPDVAWNLYAAGELLRGGILGVDVLENTPPMIFALKMPVVAAATALGVSPWVGWVLAVTGLAAGVVALIVRLLRGHPGGGGQPVGRPHLGYLIGLLILLFVVIPSDDFGQRDHLTAVLVLPLVVAGFLRLQARDIPSSLAILVGVLAGIGIGIKPHFVLLPLALFALQATRLGLRRAVVTEHVVIVLVGVGYLAAVWWLAHDYLTYAALYGPLYSRFLNQPSWVTAFTSEGAGIAYVGLALYAVFRRSLDAELRAAADGLAVATGSFLVIGVVQAKGWRYHFLPALIMGTLLTAAMTSALADRVVRGARRWYVVFGYGAVCAAVVTTLPVHALRLFRPHDRMLDADGNLALVLPLARRLGPGNALAVLSTNISSSFPLVSEAGVRWALRHPNVWPILAFHHDQLHPDAMVTAGPLTGRSAFEQRFGREIVDDLQRHRPALLLVLRANPEAIGWGSARRVDYRRYFADYAGFQDLITREYLPAATAGDYDVYWRRGFVGQSAPMTPAVTATTTLPLWVRLVTLAALLAGSAVGWVRTRPPTTAHEVGRA